MMTLVSNVVYVQEPTGVRVSATVTNEGRFPVTLVSPDGKNVHLEPGASVQVDSDYVAVDLRDYDRLNNTMRGLRDL